LDRYTFPGYPAFLERAAEELGLAPSPAGGSSPGPLAALANLCAQASTAEAAHVAEILAEAATFRDRLLVAARAAGLMLAEVTQARSATEPEPPAPAPLPDRVAEPARPRHTRPPNRPTSHRS
jgi:hypothetical protein